MHSKSRQSPKFEFQILPISASRVFFPKVKNYAICVIFEFGDASYWYYLTRSEWKNLLSFLKKIECKEYLPRNAQGYSGLNLRNNRPLYYSLKKNLKVLYRAKEHHKKEGIDTQNLLAMIKSEKIYAKEVQKAFLTRWMDLMTNRFSINLERRKFLRFRKECLEIEKKYKI